MGDGAAGAHIKHPGRLNDRGVIRHDAAGVLRSSGKPPGLWVRGDNAGFRHRVPGRFKPLPALIGPRFEPKTFGLAPARAFGLCCCLLGIGNGLGFFLGGSGQLDPLSDSLTVPIGLIPGASGSLNRGGEDEA